MKEVMDFPPLKEIVEKLLVEGIKVAERTGIKFSDNFFEFGLSYINKGGYHKPSMLLDIETGKKTEIDFFNGRIAKYGERLGIPVPYHRMITAIIKGLEQKKKLE